MLTGSGGPYVGSERDTSELSAYFVWNFGKTVWNFVLRKFEWIPYDFIEKKTKWMPFSIASIFTRRDERLKQKKCSRVTIVIETQRYPSSNSESVTRSG